MKLLLITIALLFALNVTAQYTDKNVQLINAAEMGNLPEF